MQKKYDVIIVGGGLAGLSTTVYLSDKDLSIGLFESEKFLGGRTSCWEDSGMVIESGFHRYLGFYEEMPDMLDKAGIELDDMVVWTDEIAFRLADGNPHATFGLSILHEPLETISGFLGNNDYVSPTEKLNLGKFFTQGFIDLEEDESELDQYTVLEYARKAEVSEETIRRVLVPLTEGLFFLPIEKYSAYHLFALFEPYLTKLHKSRVGAYKGCMSRAMIDPLESFLKKKDVAIFKDLAVEELLAKDGAITGTKAKDTMFLAKQVVLATPVKAAQTLLRKTDLDFKNKDKFFELTTMPAVCIQIELTEPSMTTDTVVFSPETILASYTEQSRTTFPQSEGRLSAILSNPAELMELTDEEILTQVLQDAKRLNLNLSQKQILDYRINRWKDDFYSYERGMYTKRPDTEIGLKNLLLAGDYTNQKYLQTMEGAVYSGRLAAEKITNSIRK